MQTKQAIFLDLVWDIISQAFRHSNENSSSLSPNSSLKDFFLEKVAEKGIGQDDERLILQMGEVWGAFIGDPWDKQSLKYLWLEECLDGGTLDPDQRLYKFRPCATAQWRLGNRH